MFSINFWERHFILRFGTRFYDNIYMGEQPMKILLVDIDSKIPNLALAKLRVHHERLGDKVFQRKDGSLLPFLDAYDKVYVSCVFDYNKHQCRKWEGLAEIGGSGYSLEKCLPAKIEKIRPKINLGFTTRGCVRKCSFCIVPKKEGAIHIVGNVYDLWDGESKSVKILDNNILGVPEHFFEICDQLKKEGLKVDFNGGFDHRLLSDAICREMLTLRLINKPTSRLRLAFDHISYMKSVKKALKMLQKCGLKEWQTRWYIYIGVNDTVENVLERIDVIREAKQLVFVMRDRKVQTNSDFKNIYSWGCNVWAYCKISYLEYVQNKQHSKKDKRSKLF